MITRYLAMLPAVTVLATCGGERRPVPDGSAPPPVVTDEMRQAEPGAQRGGAPSENDLGVVPGEHPRPQQLYAGEWAEIEGAWVCRGFLTRFESHDYCTADAPSDWQPFEFDGQTYYLQPLSGEPSRL